MPGTFLLTFDCEGKWGVVDRLGPPYHRFYTSERLEAAYRGVLSLLQKYRIGATFAFTGAFTLPVADFARLRPEMDARGFDRLPWMRRALSEIERGGPDGWFAPSAFRAVNEAGTHEIASHGFSHLPWGAAYANRESLETELILNRQVRGFEPDRVETFIYPRNEVTNTDLLPRHGFRMFRATRRSFGRPANLLREFNFFARSEQTGAMGEFPVALPAGYFLNWRRGIRRCIPVQATVRRWEHMLRHAARHDGVVHAWTHPENFIDGDSMFNLMERILRFVADERDAGRLRVVTCQELVRIAPAAQQSLAAVPASR